MYPRSQSFSGVCLFRLAMLSPNLSPHQSPGQPHGHGMAFDKLLLPVQKMLNICLAGWPIITAVAGSRGTDEMFLALPIHTANQSPPGQSCTVHQFFRGHGPVFADRASLFENLKDVQIITPIEQGSGITAATCKKYDLPPLRTAHVPVKCRQATSTSNGIAC